MENVRITWTITIKRDGEVGLHSGIRMIQRVMAGCGGAMLSRIYDLGGLPLINSIASDLIIFKIIENKGI